MKNVLLSRRLVLTIVMAVLLSLSVIAQTPAEKAFLGPWKGNLVIMGQTLEIRLTFTLDADKKIQGTFDSITQGASGLKLGNIVIEGKNLTCNIADLAAQGNPVFKGTLDAAGTKIAGDFTQAGYAGTFTLEKEKPQK
ncbi:MAG: hypothetical protein ACXVI6_01590 [Candidatus Aminicenantales bacterium]